MSEHLVRFRITELTSVRLRCASCKGVIEMPIDKVRTMTRDGCCCLCQEELFDHGGTGADPLERLYVAIQSLKKVGQRATIEFELPADAMLAKPAAAS